MRVRNSYDFIYAIFFPLHYCIMLFFDAYLIMHFPEFHIVKFIRICMFIIFEKINHEASCFVLCLFRNFFSYRISAHLSFD
jgi:hypothetical protein